METLLDNIFDGEGWTNFIVIMHGLVLLKIIETVVIHFRNRDHHSFYFPYIFHLFVLLTVGTHGIFYATEWAKDPDIEDFVDFDEIHYYFIVQNYIFIFLAYLSVPPDDKLESKYFSMKKFYNDNMAIWLPLFVAIESFMGVMVWADRSIMKDPAWSNYCYNVTPLENFYFPFVLWTIFAVILYKWKNPYFAIFFYFSIYPDPAIRFIGNVIDYLNIAIFF